MRAGPLFRFSLLFALAAAPICAQIPPMDVELQVNTYSTGHQSYPSMGMGCDDGCFIVAWDSFAQDGAQQGVWTRIYDPQGDPKTPEIQVNTFTTGAQQRPSIACRPSCDFIVVWQSDQDGSSDGISGQRFTEDGVMQGGEFAVNAFTTSTQSSPAAAIDDLGNFVVVWESFSQDGSGFGIVGRRFATNGTPLSGDFVVNTTTTGNQTDPSIAMTAGGAFVIAWQAPDDGDQEGIVARRYDAAGNPISSEIPINTSTTGRQIRPSVAIDDTGAFVVSWESVGQDGDGSGIFARRFDDLGNPVTGELAVNTHTTGDQSRPQVSVTVDGGFLAVWDGAGSGGAGSDQRVWARRFSASNIARDDAFQVNVFTTNSQRNAVVGTDPRGGFAVAWQSLGQDGDDFGIFARRGGFPDTVALSVDDHPSGQTSNLNGVFETGETVVVAPTWINRSNSPIAQLTSSATNFTGPAGPVYTVIDATTNYGAIPAGGTSDCFTFNGNCLEMRITGTRPVPHWDATLEEAASKDVTKTWTLHIGESFADVPMANLFYPFVENIFHNGITAGGSCGGYCTDASTLRKQMAVFVLKSKEGQFYSPPPATGVFNDVPASDPFAPWIEELYHRGVVAGCNAPNGPNYCPNDPVLRQQMAVFLLRTLEGSAYTPPGCTGVFDDVPCPGLFTDWIEELVARGITAGCGGNDYCPGVPTTRGQMAPFLVKTFGLTLYGP